MKLRRIQGTSMEPALRPGRVVLVRTRFYRLKVGDIVMIQHNGLEKVKRVTKLSPKTIKVRGDNAAHSTDSRHFGAVQRSSVVGKVITF